MKCFYTFLIILLCGCSAQSINQPKVSSVSAFSSAQPELSFPPPDFNLTWDVGGYTNFVVITSPEVSAPLEQWQVYAGGATNEVPVFVNQPRQFFMVYGTNEDGFSDWATR